MGITIRRLTASEQAVERDVMQQDLENGNRIRGAEAYSATPVVTKETMS